MGRPVETMDFGKEEKMYLVISSFKADGDFPWHSRTGKQHF